MDLDSTSSCAGGESMIESESSAIETVYLDNLPLIRTRHRMELIHFHLTSFNFNGRVDQLRLTTSGRCILNRSAWPQLYYVEATDLLR